MEFNEIDKEIQALRLKRAAIQYKDSFGFRLKEVENNTKSLCVPREEYDEYDWKQARGLSVFLGPKDLVALNIDGLLEKSPQSREDAINTILNILRLPEDYLWLAHCGDEGSFHIIIKVAELWRILPNAVETFEMGERRLELITGGRLLFPPSLTNNGTCCAFYYHQEPNTPPQYVSFDSLYCLLLRYFGEDIHRTLSHTGFYSLCLTCKSIVQTEGSYLYGGYTFFHNDEFLSYCHHPEALNTLGCIYASKGWTESEGSVNVKEPYFDKAINCFNESGNNFARENKMAMIALRDSSLMINSPENHLKVYGNYRYAYLKRLHFKYLFFDTETTGLPESYATSYKDTNNWPRLIQLSWLCVNEEGEIIAQEKRTIRPVGFSIPKESTKIHGITTELAIVNGEDLLSVLREFGDCAYYAKYLVGHNVDYDMNVVRSEMLRVSSLFGTDSIDIDYHDDDIEYEEWEIHYNPYGSEVYGSYIDAMNNRNVIDTMKSSVELCKITGYHGFKYPKLQELYSYLFGRNFENAHDSMADIKATLECFKELKRRGYIKE